jgi:hypothetical protein
MRPTKGRAEALMQRHNRLAMLALGGAAVLVLATAGLITAAKPAGDVLPPEKQALENFAATHRAEAPKPDKSKDGGRAAAKAAAVPDEPPDTGLLGPVSAPMPGGIFTSTNAWAGWTDATTYTQVYAGDSPENPGNGLVVLVRRPGGSQLLTAGATPTSASHKPPVAGGPLRILRVENGKLVMANPAGRELRFDPVEGAFE